MFEAVGERREHRGVCTSAAVTVTPCSSSSRTTNGSTSGTSTIGVITLDRVIGSDRVAGRLELALEIDLVHDEMVEVVGALLGDDPGVDVHPERG